MALELRCLTTLAVLKDELGIASGDVSKDPLLERHITRATDLAESLCDRVFYYRGAITEKCRGFGTPFLTLETRPVVFITSIDELGSVLVAADYELVLDPRSGRADSGIVVRKASTYATKGWPWTASRRPDIVQDKLPGTEAAGITVVYGGGFVTPEQAASANWAANNPLAPIRSLPHDLEAAVLEIAIALYRGRGVDKNLTLEAVTDAQQSWGQGHSLIPAAAAAILAGYTRIAGA